MRQGIQHGRGKGSDLTINVGMIANRLLKPGAAANDVGDELKTLLERALIAAEEAEQQLAAQSRRIMVLESLSVTDELTGLYNRRGFDDQLRRTLAAADRYQGQGVMAFIDLDGFKAVNDTFGHQAGDMVLRRVAKLLLGNLRTTDVVARIGGDEFAVLLTPTTPDDGCQRVAELERLIDETTVTYRSTRIPLRASFGVVPFGPGDKAQALLTRADAAMYQSKRRKPVVLHPRARATA